MLSIRPLLSNTFDTMDQTCPNCTTDHGKCDSFKLVMHGYIGALICMVSVPSVLTDLRRKRSKNGSRGQIAFWCPFAGGEGGCFSFIVMFSSKQLPSSLTGKQLLLGASFGAPVP